MSIVEIENDILLGDDWDHDDEIEALEEDEALKHFQIDALEYARKTMRCETCEYRSIVSVIQKDREMFSYSNAFIKCDNYEKTHTFELLHKDFGCRFWEKNKDE
ncbi:MAG: hypothetical protein WC495_05565 [Patescibacteria group bacterium]